jgi:type II secretory pathway pseudopilin PulG
MRLARLRRSSSSARSGRRSPRAATAAGASLLEALVVVALVGLVVMPAVPSFAAWRQRQRLDSALRHLAQEVARACAFAAASGRTHGVRFEASAVDLGWALAADGDGDGLTTADLEDGTDPAVVATERLTLRFPGLLPGRPAGVPTVAGGAADRDGMAFGGAAAVSCSADGGARSGTLYLRSERGDAAALRVYGPSARLTLWWWDTTVGRWVRAG